MGFIIISYGFSFKRITRNENDFGCGRARYHVIGWGRFSALRTAWYKAG